MDVASFFTGIGGFDIAFERLGMNIVLQCEINKYCQEILKQHWPDINLLSDIQSISPNDVPTSDFWCAGFPCQDLSQANQGKRVGLEGNRSGLFHQLADLIELRQVKERPQWLLLENVPGLLNIHKGNDFSIVLKRLSQLGYNIAWRILDAKYFGTPQRRRRIFILCSKGTLQSVSTLFEPNFEITEKQGRGIKDKESIIRPKESDDYYVFQHASIGRKPSAGPQAKGYRNDGEAYTFDSRGSADVLIRTNKPFTAQIQKHGHFNTIVSNQFRTVGNAVNVNVVQTIGDRIIKAENDEYDENWVKSIIAEFENSTLPIDISGIKEKTKNIPKWNNAGIVINGQCFMVNTLEHFSECEIKNINSFAYDYAPLDHFLHATQLQSILDRVDKRLEINPNSEKLPDRLRSVITKQRDALLRNKDIDDLLKDKKKQRDINLSNIKISEDLRSSLFVRRMTAIEYERMQGFPDQWTLLQKQDQLIKV